NLNGVGVVSRAVTIVAPDVCTTDTNEADALPYRDPAMDRVDDNILNDVMPIAGANAFDHRFDVRCVANCRYSRIGNPRILSLHAHDGGERSVGRDRKVFELGSISCEDNG